MFLIFRFIFRTKKSIFATCLLAPLEHSCRFQPNPGASTGGNLSLVSRLRRGCASRFTAPPSPKESRCREQSAFVPPPELPCRVATQPRRKRRWKLQLECRATSAPSKRQGGIYLWSRACASAANPRFAPGASAGAAVPDLCAGKATKKALRGASLLLNSLSATKPAPRGGGNQTQVAVTEQAAPTGGGKLPMSPSPFAQGLSPHAAEIFFLWPAKSFPTFRDVAAAARTCRISAAC